MEKNFITNQVLALFETKLYQLFPSIQAKNVEFQIYDVLAPIQERLNCLDSITPGYILTFVQFLPIILLSFESYNLRFNTFSANSPDKRAEEVDINELTLNL